MLFKVSVTDIEITLWQKLVEKNPVSHKTRELGTLLLNKENKNYNISYMFTTFISQNRNDFRNLPCNGVLFLE